MNISPNRGSNHNLYFADDDRDDAMVGMRAHGSNASFHSYLAQPPADLETVSYFPIAPILSCL